MKNTNLFKKMARATSGLIALGGLCVTTQAGAVGLGHGDVIINEWNAVGPDNKWLEDDGCDLQFSNCNPVNNANAEGNGGEWVELVVIKEGANLQGLQLHWENGDNPIKSGKLTFKNHVKWNGGPTGGGAGLKAGTIILVRLGGADGYGQTAGAEIFPDRGAFGCSAANGSWDEYVYVDSDGIYVDDNGTAFHVDNDDWMAKLTDSSGAVLVQNRVGEVSSAVAIVAGSGISSQEVGKLEEDPSAAAAEYSPQVCDYNDGDTSTAGFPNKWNSGSDEQCFKGWTGCGTCVPVACGS